MPSGSWKITMYGRFGSAQPVSGVSEIFRVTYSEQKKLMLTVSDPCNISVIHGDTVLESHCCLEKNISATVKNDCMLFVIKVQNKGSWFRVKFMTDGESSEQNCNNCVKMVEKFMRVTHRNSGEAQDTAAAGSVLLEGDVSLSSVARVMTGDAMAGLNIPSVYQDIQVPPDQIGTMVRLCLSDPNFPALVELVEKEVEKIAWEDS